VSGLLCEYTRTAPLAIEEAQAWDILKECLGRLKISAAGTATGLDLAETAALVRARHGESAVVMDLILACEPEIVRAVNDRG
jgi:hypothetical protein